MNRKLQVGVIEDEDAIREKLIEKLDEHNDISVMGSATSVPEGIELLSNHRFDFIFMDIVIKEGDAFLLLESLIKKGVKLPPVILNTGFADFEYAKKITNNKKANILYLLEKPFYDQWDTHLSAILDLVYAYKYKVNQSKTHISISEGGDMYRIKFDEICSVRVLEKGSGKCRVFLDKSNSKHRESVFDINMTLSKFCKQLPKQFVQISRDTVVNGNRISRFNKFDQVLFLDDCDEALAVTNTYRDELINYLFS